MNAIDSNNRTSESNIFTRLDLVKHSVRTVIEVLNENDSICLITFSNNAKVVLDITKMSESGKEQGSLRSCSSVGYSSGQRGQIVNLLPFGFESSNLSPTIATLAQR